VNPEEYAAQQALITAAVARYVQQFGRFFTNAALTIDEWLKLLQILYPEVERRRYESAVLARYFYDSQRQLHTQLPRHSVDLEGYSFKSFVQNMEPARNRMSLPESPADAVTRMTLQAVREVENAGRQQLIHSVQAEPEERIVHGWARVATGRETCEWCLMLISRGPVYLGSDTAGLDLPDWEAEKMIAAGEDVSEFMEQWHAGCDCKVVPVYDVKNWPGMNEAKRAEELWIDASREAAKTLEANPDKQYYSMKNQRWEKTTLNRETINTLRRRLESGDVSMTEFSALAA